MLLLHASLVPLVCIGRPTSWGENPFIKLKNAWGRSVLELCCEVDSDLSLDDVVGKQTQTVIQKQTQTDSNKLKVVDGETNSSGHGGTHSNMDNTHSSMEKQTQVWRNKLKHGETNSSMEKQTQTWRNKLKQSRRNKLNHGETNSSMERQTQAWRNKLK